jgi:hypothetical protein
MILGVTLRCGLPGLADVLTIESDGEMRGSGIVEYRPGYYSARRDVEPGVYSVRWVRMDTGETLDEQILTVNASGGHSATGAVTISLKRGRAHAR